MRWGKKERTFQLIVRVLTSACPGAYPKDDGFAMLSMGEHQFLTGAKSGYGVFLFFFSVVVSELKYLLHFKVDIKGNLFLETLHTL